MFLLSFLSVLYAQEFLPKQLSHPLQSDTTVTVGTHRLRTVLDSLRTPPPQLPPSTTLKADTLIPDSIENRFISRLGSLTAETTFVLTREHTLWSDGKTFDELLWRVPGLFVRTCGEVGAPTQLWAYGVSDSRLAVFLDGHPLYDPLTETFNHSYLPVEFVDYIEYGAGVTLPSSSSDVFLNFVSRNPFTMKPRTKIRYVQEPNNSLHSDMFFSQNVFRGMNIQCALHRETSDGAYTNSGLDVWGGRAKIRYNIAPSLNIAFTWMYHQLWRGINGGVEYPQSEDIFDPVKAHVQDDDAFEKHYRHDYTLNAVGYLTRDTSFRTSLTAYATTLEREFRNPPTYLSDPNVRIVTSSRYRGFLLTQSFAFAFLTGRVGFQRHTIFVDSNSVLPSVSEQSTASFGTLTANIFTIVYPSISYRREQRRSKVPETITAALSIHPSTWMKLSLRRTWTDHLPTIQEMYWRDSLYQRHMSLRMEHHTIDIAEGTVHVADNLSLQITVFHRTIDNAIVHRPSSTMYGTPSLGVMNIPHATAQGLAGSMYYSYKGFELTSTFSHTTYKESDTSKMLIPSLVATGELSYRRLLFNDALDLKLGVRTTFYNREHGMAYHPLLQLFYPETQSFVLNRALLFDLFGIFHIGDAHVSLTWTNITNRKYILTPMYPMPLSAVKLGVHWEFFD